MFPLTFFNDNIRKVNIPLVDTMNIKLIKQIFKNSFLLVGSEFDILIVRSAAKGNTLEITSLAND